MEGLDETVVQRSRNIRIVQFKVVQIVPEQVRGTARLRGHVLAVTVLARALLHRLGAAARGGKKRFHEKNARNVDLGYVAAINLRLFIGDHFLMVRR